MTLSIRDALPRDVPDLLRLVRELAEFERAADQVQATVADLSLALFGPEPKVFALVAEIDGSVVGTAIYFVNFSTWTGRHGLYLEDLVVSEAYRSAGVGRALMASLAGRARVMGLPRFEWAVLDWNVDAIRFYRGLGAAPNDEWTTYRLSGEALDRLAEGR